MGKVKTSSGNIIGTTKEVIGSAWKGFSRPFKVNHCINCQKCCVDPLWARVSRNAFHENSLSSLRRGKSSKVSFASIGRGVAGAEDDPPLVRSLRGSPA